MHNIAKIITHKNRDYTERKDINEINNTVKIIRY